MCGVHSRTEELIFRHSVTNCSTDLGMKVTSGALVLRQSLIYREWLLVKRIYIQIWILVNVRSHEYGHMSELYVVSQLKVTIQLVEGRPPINLHRAPGADPADASRELI